MSASSSGSRGGIAACVRSEAEVTARTTSAEASVEVYAHRPVGMVDQRVAVALRRLDRGVAVALVGVDGVGRVPVEQDGEPLALELARLVADLAGVAKQEVEG